jgi:SAM-dependent methyltransferase
VSGPSDRDTGVICPITGTPDVTLIQHIPTHTLIDRYRRDLDIDLGAVFDGIERIGFWESRTTGLKFFSPAVTAPPEIYAGLRHQGWYDPPDKFEFDIGAAAVSPGDRVLDIGCGAGHFAKHVPHADYTGLDASPKAAAAGLRTLSGDLWEIAQTHAEQFDVVTAFQVLEHAADPVAFVHAARALLKPGGTLVIGVPDADSYLGTFANFVLNAQPHHVTWWNARSLTVLAETVGLEDLQLHQAPVEAWEARLYWMARIQRHLRPPGAALFDETRRGRVATVAAYLLAGLTERFRTPDTAARGATTVLVGRK